MATRMAGSDEFKNELSKADRRERARTRIANSPERTANRLSGLDRDAYDFDGYSDKDIVMAMQGGSFTDKDYSRLTGTPFDDGGKDKPTPVEDPEVTTPVETPSDDYDDGFDDGGSGGGGDNGGGGNDSG